jgi:hypothetical protein
MERASWTVETKDLGSGRTCPVHRAFPPESGERNEKRVKFRLKVGLGAGSNVAPFVYFVLYNIIKHIRRRFGGIFNRQGEGDKSL